MTRPHLASGQMQALVDQMARSLDRLENFHTTDTSRDPERYAIVVPNERLEYAYVYENTGKGWVFVGDFADHYAAQRWIDRQMEEGE